MEVSGEGLLDAEFEEAEKEFMNDSRVEREYESDEDGQESIRFPFKFNLHSTWMTTLVQCLQAYGFIRILYGIALENTEYGESDQIYGYAF